MISTLTAIVCNYNHGKFIGRALEAMLQQSRPPDELIVVDDGSTDDSVAVIEGWAARSPSIRFLRNERNLGWHASSARALAAATGDYVYSGAADDYIAPGFFESVCRLMDEHPGTGIGCAKIVVVLSGGKEDRIDGYRHLTEACCVSPADYLRLCLEAEAPTHSMSGATIYRRDQLLKAGGWRSELGSWADTFAIRAIGLQTGLCYVPQTGLIWNVLPTGMSQSTMRDPLKTLAILRRAAALMRSSEFRNVFPADHVDRWEAAYFESIVLQPLQPAMQAYQTLQQVTRETAAKGGPLSRLLLGIVRRCMTACYLAGHSLQRTVIRRELLRLERESEQPSLSNPPPQR